MNRPAVSIIVPVYNVEKYLDRCIKSILSQTLSNIEIILVDDGSPDNCPRMCDEYAQQDSRIKVIHKKNAGLGMACNSGIGVATGEYIAFCDSDDWVELDMYENMLNAANNHNADAVFTGLKRVNNKGDILGLLPHPNSLRLYNHTTLHVLAKDLIASNPTNRYDHIIQVSAKVVLYRRAVIHDNNIRFVSERQFPSEDLIFNLSFIKYAQSAVIVPKYFYNYYDNESSITTTFNPNRFDMMMKTVEYLKDTISTLDGEIYIRIARLIIGEARLFARQIISSSISKSEKNKLLNALSCNTFFTDAIDSYPVSKMPLVHRIAMYLLNNRYYSMLKLIYMIG